MILQTIPAHFEDCHVQFDEPVTIKPHSKLLVTVLPSEEDVSFDAEGQEWTRFALTNFAQLYEDEPDDYTEDMIIEPNPNYHDPWENRLS
jgi:hypothetical protein